MNYEIVIENGSKSVLFEDGEKHFVNVNKEGKEYFAVSNHYSNHPFKLFLGRIKDAIQTIRDGNGDVLNVTELFGRSESVYRFLDREYGESLRAQTLEGFKDTEFGYSLKFGYLNSMSGSRFVSKEQEIIGVFDEPNNYIYFDSEEKAETFKQELLSNANQKLKEYNKIKATNDKNAIKYYIQNNYNTDIISQLWGAMAEGDGWKLETVQVTKN